MALDDAAAASAIALAYIAAISSRRAITASPSALSHSIFSSMAL
eukprot:CAMPEP_0113244594 /NCGR_PEP_ID=MMETSP0008_2-20120614/8486_1 /TAXON_ID=97485 /ORGANISM="Prymnesium parvum" /LENGTH=43 /DNA_ID=CAMNT_0000092225 /DNA_START=51 /DNA_END=179 /DNA_ORIENTATION=+ /assembly_acc=CAM_ASM_000153